MPSIDASNQGRKAADNVNEQNLGQAQHQDLNTVSLLRGSDCQLNQKNNSSAEKYLPGDFSIHDPQAGANQTTNGDRAGAKSDGAKDQPEAKKHTEPFADKISAAGVEQAGVGDCFFDSALASLANSQKGQQIIKNMIKENKDDSYTVTFPGDSASPINVSQKDLSDNKKNGNVLDRADWARIIETAFLKYDHAAQYNSGLNNKWQKEGIPVFGNVFSPDKALHLLTGEESSTDSQAWFDGANRDITLGRTSKANVARDLENAFKNGEPVTAGIGVSLQNDSRGLVHNHAYSVLSYDPKTQEVIVRNPWGNNGGTPFAETGVTKDGITSLGNGELKMSLDTFSKTFTDVNFSGSDWRLHDLKNIGNDASAQANSARELGSDLLSGKFSQLGGDMKDYLGANAQTGNDIIFTATNSLCRNAKSTFKDITNTVSSAVHGDLNKTAKNVLRVLNPFA